MPSFSRRSLLGAAAALPLLSRATAPQAAAPFRNQLPPAWHRFRIGEFEATVVSDGYLPLGKPQDSFVGPGSDRSRPC